MSVNLNKSGLGKFAGMHGTIFKSEIAAAKPSKQIVGKGIGKGCNYPMDSDAEFEKRLRRYERKKQANGLTVSGSIADTVSEVKRLSVESSRIISEIRGACMNDIEKVNVAPDGYFQRIVKPCLLDLRKRKDDAKTDMERGYYEDRYAAQAKDFAQALHISAEVLDELIGGV